MGTTLTGKRVQNTYDSLLKLSDNDNLTGTPKIVGSGLGTDSPIYLSTSRVGIGMSPTVQFQTSGNAQIGNNLVVGGNLTVNGTTTFIDSTIVEIGDNMIELAKDNIANIKDIGWYGTINDGSEKYVGVFYDASTGTTTPEFHVGLGTVEPSSTASWTTKGKLVIGALDATTGVFSGQVTIPQTPSANTDAASKGYVDSAISSGSVEVAKRIEITVKNISGASLSKGTIVHASPSASPPSGNVVEVIAADYDDATKMPGIGVLNETIANDNEGSAVMMGAVSGIDTSSFSAGDELFVGNNGAFTNTKPTANNELIQKIAIVLKVHASNGSIKVFGAGRVNDVPNQINRNVNFTDNSKLTFGDSTTPDLQIYHNGSNSFIQDSGTGNLILSTSFLTISNAADSEFMAKMVQDAQVELYYNGSKKFETTSTGISVTGLGQFSNKILVADGSATAPSYSFTNDTDSGIYNSGTQLILTHAGSNRIVIGGSQIEINDGLIVNDSISADDYIMIDGNSNPYLQIQDITNENYVTLYSGDTDGLLAYTTTNFKIIIGEVLNQTNVVVFDSSSNSTFYGDVLPDTDSANDLGSTSLRWANVWADNINGGTPVNGSGTANDVVMWSDSDTLTDAPIAISGNNSTFAGDVTLGDTSSDHRSLSIQTNSEKNSIINLKEGSNLYGFSLGYYGVANDFIIKRHDNSASGTDVLTLNRDDNNATFAGSVTANTGSKITSSSADTTFSIETTSGTTIFPVLDFVSSHSSAGARIRVSGTDVISIDKSQNSTFAGNVVITGSGSSNSASLQIDNPDSNSFNHSIEAFAANLTSGESNVLLVGKEGSTRNAGYIGYNWASSGSVDNYITFGHWGVDHIVKIYGSGDIHLNSYAYAVANVNSTGDSGLNLFGNRLGFDESGTRSWTIKAASGQLNFYSGDNNGAAYFFQPTFAVSSGSAQNLDVVLSNTRGNTADRVRIQTTAGGVQWDLENDQNLDAFKIRYSTGAADVLKLTNGSPENSIVTTSTGVGISTTSPAQKLHIASGHIRIDSGYALLWDDSHERIEQSDGHLEFFINNGQAMTLNTNGLGIGTISPSTKLHISGGDPSIRLTPSGSNDARVDFTDSGGTVRWYTGYDVSSGNLVIASDEGGFGSSNIIVMNDSGNVGISTTSPSYKLQVNGTAYINETLYVNGATTIDDNLYVTNGSVGIGTSSPSKPLHIQTNNSSYGSMRIYRDSTTQGEVSIGFFAKSNQTTNQAWVIGEGGWIGGGKFVIGNENGGAGGNVRLVIEKAGNVGIGTTSPSEILQTNKNSAGNIVGGYFTNSQANTGAESVSLAFGLNRSGGDFVRQVKAITFGAEQQWTGTPSTVDGYLAFSTVSNETVSEKMRITSDGMVGIGMTPSTVGSSTYMLQMYNSGSQCLLAIGNGTSGNGPLNGLVIGNDTGHAYVINREATPLILSTNDTERMRIDSSGATSFAGSASVSTAVASIQHLSSNGYLYIKGGSGGLIIGDDSTSSRIQIEDNSNIRFETAGTERMRIDSSGNVGIGRTGPSEKMDIQGNVKIFPEGSSWAEGLSFSMPTQNVWGGIRWRRERSNSDGNHYIGYVGNYTNDDLVFGSNNGGSQVDYSLAINKDGRVTFGGTTFDTNGQTTINTSKQYGLVINYNQLNYGTDFDDALFIKNINNDNNNLAAIGMSTNGSDGQHHRATLIARRDTSASYRGNFFIKLRQSDATHQYKLFLQYNGDLHADGDVVAYSTTISDKRLKDKVVTIDSALDKVKSLRGVEYVWNNGSKKGKKDLGVIAQEVEEILPEIVTEKKMELMDGKVYKTVDYEKLTAVLIESVKELSAKVEILENKKCNCNCK